MNVDPRDTAHEDGEPNTRLTVLLVDDDAELRALLEIILEEDGRFDVVGQAADGSEALALAQSARPDIVVLDLLMPGMDGLRALPQLRQLLPHARIVVVSAFPDPYTLLDAVKLGADGYIDKTRVWRELLPTVAGLCALV